MDKLENLLQVVSDENIILHYDNSLPYQIEGLYVNIRDVGPAIFLLNSLKQNKSRHVEILGEELGHHFTSVGDSICNAVTYRDQLDILKCEKKATDWSTNYIITNNELIKALEYGCNSFYEISEFLNVNELVVRDKFEYLARKSCTGYVQLGNYKVILTNLPNIYLYKDL